MLYREDSDVLSWLMGEEEREGKKGSSGLEGGGGVVKGGEIEHEREKSLG